LKKNTSVSFDTKKIWKTPHSEAIWPKVILPETKFDPAGVYEIRFKVKDPEHEKKFLAEMEEEYELAYRQTCEEKHQTQLPRDKPPWKKDSDGRTIFKAKLKASGVFDGQPWENKPPKLYDAAAKRIESPDPNKLRSGNGSIVRVVFRIYPYPRVVQKFGITLRLKGVQLLKLIEYDEAKHFDIQDEADGDDYYRHEAPAPEARSAEEPDTAVDVEQLKDEEPELAPVGKIADDSGDDDIPF